MKTTLPDTALPCRVDEMNRPSRTGAGHAVGRQLAYATTGQGFVHVAFVIDAFVLDRGGRRSRTARAGFVLDAVEGRHPIRTTVACSRLRIVISSIMRRRSGLIAAVLLLQSSSLRFNSRNPPKQKRHQQMDPPNAASAAPFNLEFWWSPAL
jgi:hypothetical protein